MTDLQERARNLWQREGGHCVSHLIYTMATAGNSGSGFDMGDLGKLMDQALELSMPVYDWEEAAIQAGWEQRDDGFWYRLEWAKAAAGALSSAQSACEAFDIEPYQREVYEHWIVSDWLADKLAAHGELVDKDFAGLTIWARTTTGQAVYADYVIEQIARELTSTI